jgi:hypothetical protein
MDEPLTLIPQGQAVRLRQLERREELQMAERRSDEAFLDRELEKVQLTPADLARLSAKNTPISQWPDEDMKDCFGESVDTQDHRGKGK